MENQTETEKPRRAKSLVQSLADPLDRLHDEMDRMFNSYMRGINLPRLGFHWSEGALLANLDVSETPEAVQIVADVPGVNEKDIEITLSNHTLTLKGKRESSIEEKKKNYHRVERSYGEFQRRITLPCEIDRDHVDAKLKDGVLTVSLQKTAKAMEGEKKIPVKAT